MAEVGGSHNLHVHFHLLAADAVFEKTGAGVRAHEAPPQAKSDLDEVAEERSNAPKEPSPIEALASLVLTGGTFVSRHLT